MFNRIVPGRMWEEFQRMALNGCPLVCMRIIVLLNVAGVDLQQDLFLLELFVSQGAICNAWQRILLLETFPLELRDGKVVR